MHEGLVDEVVFPDESVQNCEESLGSVSFVEEAWGYFSQDLFLLVWQQQLFKIPIHQLMQVGDASVLAKHLGVAPADLQQLPDCS